MHVFACMYQIIDQVIYITCEFVHGHISFIIYLVFQ